MAAMTEQQADYILQLANQLTGERARYLSQSSAVTAPKTKAEASALIDDLKEAIDAEENRRATSPVLEGNRITFDYQRKNGDHAHVTATVLSYIWYGLRPSAIRVWEPDEQTATWCGTRTYLALDRMTNVRLASEDPATLRAEREQLLARLAEIDKLLTDAG